MDLAVRVMVHPTEAAHQHKLSCVLMDEDGAQVGTLEAAFEVNTQATPNIRPGEEYNMPVALPLSNLPLPAAGFYSFEMLIDGVHQASVPFEAAVNEDALPLEEVEDQ